MRGERRQVEADSTRTESRQDNSKTTTKDLERGKKRRRYQDREEGRLFKDLVGDLQGHLCAYQGRQLIIEAVMVQICKHTHKPMREGSC